MKKNRLAVFSVSRVASGVALLALCAFIPASHADVVVDNLPSAGYTTTGSGAQGNQWFGEAFTMSSSAGSLSSVTLSLNFVAPGDSANVYLYGTSSGVPAGPGTLLGLVSGSSTMANDLVMINGLNNPLSANTTYAIVLGPTTSGSSSFMSWNSTSTPGSVGPAYSSIDGVSFSSYPGPTRYFQMEVDMTPVPEVPVTGVAMGFGALAIALSSAVRRKFQPTVSETN